MPDPVPAAKVVYVVADPAKVVVYPSEEIRRNTPL